MMDPKLFAALAGLTISSAGYAAVVSGPVVSPINGHTYYLLSQDSWTNSEVEAESLGGHLATVRSAAENQWISDTFGAPGQNLWIGINDAPFEGDFRWISGETVTYTNWYPGEPSSGDQDYGNIWQAHAPAWDNYLNSSVNPYLGVVEVAPGPKQTTLTYRITGNIDTSDFLIIHGGTLQWHHTDTGGAAVGRHSGTNLPTTITAMVDGVTVMDDVSWTPTWPSPVPNEIRFDALSSVYTGLTVPLPGSGTLDATAVTFSGRGSAIVTQEPTAGNDYTLIVRFADGFNGSADLDAQINIVLVPEPLTGMMFLAGGAVLMLHRRRKNRQTIRPA